MNSHLDLFRVIIQIEGVWHNARDMHYAESVIEARVYRPQFSWPPGRSAGYSEPDSGITDEADPEFLERARREVLEKPVLPWAA